MVRGIFYERRIYFRNRRKKAVCLWLLYYILIVPDGYSISHMYIMCFYYSAPCFHLFLPFTSTSPLPLLHQYPLFLRLFYIFLHIYFYIYIHIYSSHYSQEHGEGLFTRVWGRHCLLQCEHPQWLHHCPCSSSTTINYFKLFRGVETPGSPFTSWQAYFLQVFCRTSRPLWEVQRKLHVI